jgi:hypothetical protein
MARTLTGLKNIPKCQLANRLEDSANSSEQKNQRNSRCHYVRKPLGWEKPANSIGSDLQDGQPLSKLQKN